MQRYPLAWPQGWKRTPPGQRKRGKFNKKTTTWHAPTSPGASGYSNTRSGEVSIAEGCRRVLAQLGSFGAYGEAIISTNVEVRLDGLPRSGQRAPDDPGAAVYWTDGKTKQQKVMAIDLYDRVADNLAAIAATLDAMRAIERHGGASILDRAFTGFDALPPPGSPWAVLRLKPGASAEAINEAYRTRAKLAHPDNGGTDQAMTELNVARDECLRQIGAA